MIPSSPSSTVVSVPLKSNRLVISRHRLVHGVAHLLHVYLGNNIETWHAPTLDGPGDTGEPNVLRARPIPGASGGGGPVRSYSAGMPNRHLTLTQWGAYELERDGDDVVAVHPFAADPDPSPIGQSLSAVRQNRVMRPAVRESWLRQGPGAAPERRGAEPFVEVDWDTVLDLAAGELDRVRSEFGNEAIYGGSYGWASAGRFHHTQSQIHRFLAAIGGYTRSVNSYSLAAAEVIVPHVLGMSYDDVQSAHTSWPVIAAHTDLFVAFGGIPLKNSQVQYGGHGRHLLRHWVETAAGNGTRFVNISPIRDDVLDAAGAEWLPVRPNTDTAVMLALATTMVEDGTADEGFLDRYCTGWDRFAAYLAGAADGVAKTAEWAAEISGLDPDAIRELARAMTAGRTMVNASWSLQRADHGEQPFWATMALASVVGQIGLPGGGFGLGYGAVGSLGNGVNRVELPRLGRGHNAVRTFIPVARIADMLLDPGGEFDYDGGRYRYPDIRLIYWAGGNPFHHHQDLNRLLEAWRKPETVIVHEPVWNALARHADIVLPATTSMERTDIGGAPVDDHLFAMEAVIPPVGEARNDFDIFAGLSERLGVGEVFTEGRNADEWVRHLYERFRTLNPGRPPYEEFVALGHLRHGADPSRPAHLVLLDRFRSDPDAHPLVTPSGRIELWSETIAGFGYGDCPPHPTWLEPAEWLGAASDEAVAYPLHLISNQPATRLHSQWDHGVTSRNSKIADREPVRLHPADADARGIASGDVVRIFNDRGSCLAGALVSDALRPGVVQLSTGAWFDPVEPATPGSMCRHGNPNVLTRDAGTSSLAQGPTAQTCLVEVERWEGPVPAVGAFELPELI